MFPTETSSNHCLSEHNFLRVLQRAGNAERVHGWGIATFCGNLEALAVSLVTCKLETISENLAQPETFFSPLKKHGPWSVTAGVGRSSES